MASGVPDYQRRVGLTEGPSPGVRGIPIPGAPSLPDLSGADKALSGLGAEITQVANKLEEGQQHTLASQGMEQFITQNAKLKQDAIDDQDYAGAPKRYAEDVAQLQRDSLANITDPQIRGRTSLEITRLATTSANDVRTAQVAREKDVNWTANDTLSRSSLTDAATAKSPQERQAAIDRYIDHTEGLKSAGWMDGQTAAARLQSFKGQLDQADALKLGQDNPRALLSALDTPDMFTSLDPVRRETLRIAAQSKLDGNYQAWAVQAARFHQEAASLTIGTLVAPEHGAKLFDNGIVKVEGAKDNNEVSNRGAIGFSQILPGTARDMATSLGKKDIAALPEADLVQRLKDDPKLNLDLGREYFTQMLKRYDGNAVLAAAAYNAGPARADAWRDKAGPNAGPADIANVIDIKETRNYIDKLFKVYNAPMDVKFSSTPAMLNAAAAIGAVLTQQDARESHIASAQAKMSVSTDPIAQLVEAGMSVDPMRIANQRALLTAAANRGDQTAASNLHDLEFAVNMQPAIKQAQMTPPAILEQQIKGIEAEAARPGANVDQSTLYRLKAYKAVAEAQAKARDDEPVTLGVKSGIYALAPIDPAGNLDDGMVSSLQARDAQARFAHSQWGGSGSPFTVQEAEALHQRFLDATPQDRTAMLGTMAKGLSQQSFAAAFPQVVSGASAKSDRPALMAAAGLYQSAPDVANGIMQGVGGEDTYLPSKGANREVYTTKKSELLPPALFTTAQRLDPKGPYAGFADAIDAQYSYLSAKANDSSKNLNSARLKEATDAVTGGILYHNGVALLPPARGMSQSQFDGVIWGLKNEDMAGAQTTSGTPIDAAYVRDVAKLRAQSDGRYWVQINHNDDKPQYAATKSGVPFVLDLRNRQPGTMVYDPLKSGGPQP